MHWIAKTRCSLWRSTHSSRTKSSHKLRWWGGDLFRDAKVPACPQLSYRLCSLSRHADMWGWHCCLELYFTFRAYPFFPLPLFPLLSPSPSFWTTTASRKFCFLRVEKKLLEILGIFGALKAPSTIATPCVSHYIVQVSAHPPRGRLEPHHDDSELPRFCWDHHQILSTLVWYSTYKCSNQPAGWRRWRIKVRRISPYLKHLQADKAVAAFGGDTVVTAQSWCSESIDWS